MKTLNLRSLCLGLWLIGTVPVFAELSEDESRAIYESFTQVLSVNAEGRAVCQMAIVTPGEKPLEKKYILYSKKDKSLLVTLQPVRDYGKKFLMSGDMLWQYFPKINKTVAINSSMLLGGNTNLTDIVSSSLFQFYNLQNIRFDETEKIHVLIFAARSNRSPYDSLRFYFRDNKIEYLEAFARSGVLVKKILFVSYAADSSGRLVPTRLKIINALKEGEYVLFQMSAFEGMSIPDYYFNPAALDRVKE